MRDRYAGFDAFVATRGPALMRTASLLSADRAAAEAALQEALTRAALHWPEISDGGAPEQHVRTELYKVVVNGWPSSPPSDAELGPALAAGGFAPAFARLSLRQRAALVLSYYENLSDAEVAEVLGCSERTATFETGQALARLRALQPSLADELTAEQRQDFTDGGSAEVLS